MYLRDLNTKYMKLDKLNKWFGFKKIFEPKEINKSKDHLSVEELECIKDEGQVEARNSPLPPHIVCKAIELMPGDIIIHKCFRFKISQCGCGASRNSASEFGDYFWIQGSFIYGDSTKPEPNCEFWAFQNCPMIKLL